MLTNNMVSDIIKTQNRSDDFLYRLSKLKEDVPDDLNSFFIVYVCFVQ